MATAPLLQSYHARHAVANGAASRWQRPASQHPILAKRIEFSAPAVFRLPTHNHDGIRQSGKDGDWRRASGRKSAMASPVPSPPVWMCWQTCPAMELFSCSPPTFCRIMRPWVTGASCNWLSWSARPEALAVPWLLSGSTCNAYQRTHCSLSTASFLGDRFFGPVATQLHAVQQLRFVVPESKPIAACTTWASAIENMCESV
jgi:hypothetical protein